VSQDNYLHLEHDGKLLLVDKNGNGPQIPIKGRTNLNEEKGWVFRLPKISEVAEMEINWTKKGESVLDFNDSKITVIKGHPEIPWPENWAWKDDTISDSLVHPIARESVYRSLHRLVSKVVIQNEENQILMAKVKRGHFTGFWTLPGGYLDHDEQPHIGAARETLEELGIEIIINETNSSIVSQKIFTEEGISFVSFTYLVKIKNEDLKFNLKIDEIEEIFWFSRNDAMKSAMSWFDLQAIEKLTK
tara:strand:- start:30 stop:767 length:738 start_codon:yes stop_codon:yes gene_type:complete